MVTPSVGRWVQVLRVLGLLVDLSLIGKLSHGALGTIRFVYEPTWLKQVNAFPFNPALDILAGDFFPGSSNFGLFMDSCPYRWHQLLMKPRKAIEAKEEWRTPRALGTWDFLLEVWQSRACSVA